MSAAAALELPPAPVAAFRTAVLQRLETRGNTVRWRGARYDSLRMAWNRLLQGPFLLEATQELLRLSYFLHSHGDAAGAQLLFDLASTSLPLLHRHRDGKSLTHAMRQHAHLITNPPRRGAVNGLVEPKAGGCLPRAQPQPRGR